MNMSSNATNETVQKAAFARADDNDLTIDRDEAEEDVNQMIQVCNNLHTVLEGNVQEEKSKFFAHE